MRSNSAVRAVLPRPHIHPALRSFADECGDAVVRMLAYIGGLALIAIIVVYAANPFTDAAVSAALEPVAKPGWSMAARSYPAFAVSQFDLPGKTEAYEILRHPDGGRKDILRWAAPGEKPVAEIEIYRIGAESAQSGPPAAEIAARMDPDELRAVEAAGVIDSKFGYVTLLDLAERSGSARPCLGFIKNLDDAGLRLSGFTCQGDAVPARRAAIGCMLNRLVLLSAGNDPRLAEAFARAELRRGACTPSAAQPATSADWVTGAQNPRLRGGF
jgi:hypothetical protein